MAIFVTFPENLELSITRSNVELRLQVNLGFGLPSPLHEILKPLAIGTVRGTKNSLIIGVSGGRKGIY